MLYLETPCQVDSRKLVGKCELEMMKPDSYLINTCRGGVVDEQTLYTALKEGRIAGAGLGVLDEEPTPPDNPLFDLPNVVITPTRRREPGERTAWDRVLLPQH